MPKNLTLTGMMGTGKTTIGKILAKKLKYSFVDIDRIIEKKEGSSINLIFKNKNESYFRKIEIEITLLELKKDSSVISLGGGAFLNNVIRKNAKKLSNTFWLDVPIEELVKRLKNGKKRPLFLIIIFVTVSFITPKSAQNSQKYQNKPKISQKNLPSS